MFVCFSWEITRENDFNDKHDELEFTGLNVVWVVTILEKVFWIGIIQVAVACVIVILGGNFSSGKGPGGSYYRLELA